MRSNLGRILCSLAVLVTVSELNLAVAAPGGSPDKRSAPQAQSFAIQLDPPLAAGKRYLASGTMQLDQEGAGEKHLKARFEIAVKVIEVTPRGNMQQAVLTIRELEQQSAGSTIVLLPPGAEVIAHRDGGKLSFEKGGIALSEELSEIFRLFTLGDRDDNKPSDDQAFGTELRRRVGESWSVNPAAVAALLSAPFPIDPKDIAGSTTLIRQS